VYGAGDRDYGSKNIMAFQKLWNRYNPKNKIPEDGIYGTETVNALNNSPCNGWTKSQVEADLKSMSKTL